VFLEQRRQKGHAFTSSSNGSDCGRCLALVGQSLHTDGGIHQIDLEWRRRDLRGFVAPEHFWAVSFSLSDPRRDLNRFEGATDEELQGRVQESKD
jgi:hypothetical protein